MWLQRIPQRFNLELNLEREAFAYNVTGTISLSLSSSPRAMSPYSCSKTHAHQAYSTLCNDMVLTTNNIFCKIIFWKKVPGMRRYKLWNKKEVTGDTNKGKMSNKFVPGLTQTHPLPEWLVVCQDCVEALLYHVAQQDLQILECGCKEVWQ